MLYGGKKQFRYLTSYHFICFLYLNDSDENIRSMEKLILGEISGWDNNIINSTDNLKMTKQLFDNNTYNKKI